MWHNEVWPRLVWYRHCALLSSYRACYDPLINGQCMRLACLQPAGVSSLHARCLRIPKATAATARSYFRPKLAGGTTVARPAVGALPARCALLACASTLPPRRQLQRSVAAGRVAASCPCCGQFISKRAARLARCIGPSYMTSWNTAQGDVLMRHAAVAVAMAPTIACVHALGPCPDGLVPSSMQCSP